MLNPDYLLRISEGSEEIASQLHNEIIKRIVNRIMLRIGRGETYLLTSQDQWQISTLQQAGYLLEDIQKEIAKYTKLQQSEIAEAMEEAGVKTLDYDDKIYQSVGLSPTPLTQSPELIRLMQRNYNATLGEWNNFTRTMADEAQRLFINQLDMAYTLVSTGALSYTQAVKEVLNNIVTDGIVVTYPSGHSDTIETATLRAVRTGISQATGQIQTARMDEMNVDLVITSSHLGARPSHQVWQGKVFSRSGDSKYPPFEESTGYGTVSGLCGANCRHSFSPYFEGMDNPFEQYDSEENRKQYEKEQYQRTLERRIRKTKREVIGLKESVDSCKDDKLKFDLDMDYQRKSALLAKQNKAYREYCERNNLKPLSDRIQIAKWDRQQAAAARGAAKRYENAHGGSVSKNISNQNIFENPYERNRTGERVIRASKQQNEINIENASTLTELNQIASKKLDTKVNFENCSLEYAKEQIKCYKKLTEEYIQSSKVTEFGTGKMFGKNATAETFLSPDYKYATITVSGKNSKQTALDRLHSYTVKVDDKNVNISDLVHEFAHTISASKSGNYEDFWKEIKSIKNRYNRALTKIDKENIVDKTISYEEAIEKKRKIFISEYANKTIDEFMAEGFSDALLTSEPSPYSQEILELIKKYFKK